MHRDLPHLKMLEYRLIHEKSPSKTFYVRGYWALIHQNFPNALRMEPTINLSKFYQLKLRM